MEPEVKFFCDSALRRCGPSLSVAVLEDPFAVMRANDYVYGWTISIYEYRATIETLVRDLNRVSAHLRSGRRSAASSESALSCSPSATRWTGYRRVACSRACADSSRPIAARRITTATGGARLGLCVRSLTSAGNFEIGRSLPIVRAADRDS